MDNAVFSLTQGPMDKWVKTAFEWRYEFSRDSGEKFVIRIDDNGALLGAYVLLWQRRDSRGYWRENALGDRFATLSQAKDYAAMLLGDDMSATWE